MPCKFHKNCQYLFCDCSVFVLIRGFRCAVVEVLVRDCGLGFIPSSQLNVRHCSVPRLWPRDEYKKG